MVDVFLGAIYLIGRILDKDVLFHRILECLADDGMVVDNGVSGATIIEDGLVEILDVLRGKCPKLNGRSCEVGNDPGFP